MSISFDPGVGKLAEPKAGSTRTSASNWATRALVGDDTKTSLVEGKVRAVKQPEGGGVALYVEFAGNNPLVPGSPNLDTQIAFAARERDGALCVAGEVTGDGFPNAEIFIEDDAGTRQLLFDYRTGSGRLGPLYRLIGNGDDEVLGTFMAVLPVDDDDHFNASPAFTQQEILWD
jgi:hypothetical protein